VWIAIYTNRKALVPHRNAPLTEPGRLRLARCVVEDGWTLRRAAERFQVSPTTAQRWADRYRELGEAGMSDHSSRPHHSPRRTPTRTERRIIKVRLLRRWGAARIAYLLRSNPSTVHRVPARYKLAHLVHLDRATGRMIRRYERSAPGELVHVDIKKLGNIPDGGGHKLVSPGDPLGPRPSGGQLDLRRRRAAGPDRTGPTAVASPELLEFLRPMAVHGRLPRWTDWWDEADVAPMFADPMVRQTIIEEQPTLPLSYYEQHIPVPDGCSNGTPGKARQEYERGRPFRRMRIWRVGIKARISHLRRGFSFRRTLLRHLAGAQTWPGLGIFAYRLHRMSAVAR
jgi:transposase-like protein